MAKFVFVSGDDEFLVNQRAKVLFSKAAESCEDEFSVETIEGMAQTVDDVANAVTRTLLFVKPRRGGRTIALAPIDTNNAS